MRAVGMLAFAVLLGGARVAHAQAVPAPQQAIEVERYGYQIALVDTAGVALIVAAVPVLRLDDDRQLFAVPMLIVGTGLYVCGGAAVHSFHGRKANTSASIAFHALFPIVGAVAGAKLSSCENELGPCDERDTRGAIGLAIGMVTATTLDAVWLAKKERAVVYAAPTPGGATVSLTMSF